MNTREKHKQMLNSMNFIRNARRINDVFDIYDALLTVTTANETYEKWLGPVVLVHILVTLRCGSNS